MKTIVIIWATKTALVPTGKLVRFDSYNWRTKFELGWEGHAALWLNKGTDEDMRKALEYAAKINAKVVTFDPSDNQWKTKAQQLAVNNAETENAHA